MERQAKLCMLLLLLSFVSYSMGRQPEQGWIKSALNDDEKGCKYIIKTQTSDKKRAKLSAKVRMTLCSWHNKCFLDISDLAQYGDRGPNYANYFDRGSYSHFEITSTDWCHPTCQIIVSHDGSGRNDRWGLDFITVEAQDNAGAQKYFETFPMYGTIDRGETSTVDKCPVTLGHHDKSIDVEAKGITRVFASVVENIIA